MYMVVFAIIWGAIISGVFIFGSLACKLISYLLSRRKEDKKCL